MSVVYQLSAHQTVSKGMIGASTSNFPMCTRSRIRFFECELMENQVPDTLFEFLVSNLDRPKYSRNAPLMPG
jgi:hypothetical protein